MYNKYKIAYLQHIMVMQEHKRMAKDFPLNTCLRGTNFRVNALNCYTGVLASLIAQVYAAVNAPVCNDNFQSTLCRVCSPINVID